MKLMYVELNRDEAADKTLMDVLDRFCVGVSLTGTAVVKSIGPDNPAVGAELSAPAYGSWNPDSSLPVSPATLNTAAIFGQQPPVQAAAPTPALSTAAVVQPPTVPVAPSSIAAPVNAPPVPNPVAPVVAPSAPAAPTNPAGGVELDSTGLPWDGRIHSSKKSKTDDGKWRMKKGLNGGTDVKGIEAALRASLTVQAPAVVAAPPAVVAPAVAQQNYEAIAQAAQQAAAAVAAPVAMPPAVVPPVAPPAPAVPAGPTMASLMGKLSPHMASGLLSPARQNHLFGLVGVTAFPELMARQDLIEKLDPIADQWVTYWQSLAAAGHPHTTITV